MFRRFHVDSALFIRNLMIFVNFIIILFFSSIILLTTRYVIANEVARDFLETLEHLPMQPMYSYFIPLLLYAVLSAIIYLRQTNRVEDQRVDIAINLLEILICFIIIFMLYMGYNGILLLVFADIISYMKTKKTYVFLAVLIVVFLLSNYHVVSIQIPMTSIDSYISVYEATTRNTLYALINLLESLNLILFILFMIVYIANQIQENENITKELSMINRVNRELQNYAEITEKIGEDKERKRIAREIHDTLGHALTGIAAGIDACIAMIDLHPKETKKQLFAISKVVRQGIGDVRGSLNKLRPGALEKHTFKEAIVEMIEEFTGVSELKVDLLYELDDVDFEKIKEDVLFRVIQESLTNSMRHGNATLLTIHVYEKEQVLCLTIEDNGEGCETIVPGFGLKQMQERIGIINGDVTFDGTNGFTTHVKIPMKKGEYND